jgi:hypothetical protein
MHTCEDLEESLLPAARPVAARPFSCRNRIPIHDPERRISIRVRGESEGELQRYSRGFRVRSIVDSPGILCGDRPTDFGGVESRYVRSRILEVYRKERAGGSIMMRGEQCERGFQPCYTSDRNRGSEIVCEGIQERARVVNHARCCQRERRQLCVKSPPSAG